MSQVERVLTGIPILGKPSAKSKLIKKMVKDRIGYMEEGGRLSFKDYTYKPENRASVPIRFLFLEVSQKATFKNMRKALYETARTALAIFEFTDGKSLRVLEDYVQELRAYTTGLLSLVLIGNSVNLIKKGSEEASIDMVRKYKKKIKDEVRGNFLYLELKSFHKDFEDIFDFLAESILQNT